MPDEQTTQKLIQAIENDLRWDEQEWSRLLILPPTYHPGLGRVFNCFSEVWRLRPEVMGDAVGPYPSLRAERSIIKSLAGAGMRDVVYYWPSVRLPQRGYKPIFLDSEIEQAWASYIRKNIRIEVNP